MLSSEKQKEMHINYIDNLASQGDESFLVVTNYETVVMSHILCKLLWLTDKKKNEASEGSKNACQISPGLKKKKKRNS